MHHAGRRIKATTRESSHSHSQRSALPRSKKTASHYPLTLLAIFSVWWTLLAIAPKYRADWVLENILTLVVAGLLLWGYRHLRFSNLAYTLIFIFMCLHEVGAHYTYAEVPYREWFHSITGKDFNIVFNIERNHFDRLVHFSFGLLILPACIEIFDARAKLVGLWRYLVPVTFIMAQSELFEMIEWQAAIIFGGPLGQAYLGTQGDIWDAQKDSLAAAVGAVLSMMIYQARKAYTKKRHRV